MLPVTLVALVVAADMLEPTEPREVEEPTEPATERTEDSESTLVTLDLRGRAAPGAREVAMGMNDGVAVGERGGRPDGGDDRPGGVMRVIFSWCSWLRRWLW